MSTSTAPENHAPRYALVWAGLTYLLLLLTLGYPALTGGFLVTLPSDQYIGGFPVRDFAAQSLKHGLGIPLWNPYIFGGMPYVAAMGVGDIYYPTQLLRYLLPVDIGMTLGMMIHVWLAGVFMFAFCRAMGLSFWASLVGGAAYMMCGPTAGLVSPGHDGKLFVGALTPLAMLLLLRWVREAKVWALGMFAIVIGLGVLSPHPQLLQYMLLLCGAFGLYAAFGWNGNRLATSTGIQRLALAGVAVGVGFAIGAIQYAPFIEYVPFSPRSEGIAGGYETATSYSLPINEILNFYIPEFTGMLGKYWGVNGIHHHSEYMGVAVLMLATAAVGAKGKSIASSRSFKLFMLGALIVSLLWALGSNTPFYKIIYAVVPGTKFFRAPSTIMYISAFAIVLFAAIGVDRLLSRDAVSRRWLAIWGAFAGIIWVMAVSGGLTNVGKSIVDSHTRKLFPANADPRQVESTVADRVDRVPENSGALALGGIRGLAFAALALGLIFAVGSGRITGPNAALAMLALVAADLWSIERKYWGFSKRASVVYASDATIDYLKARPDSGRVLTLQLTNDMAYHDAMMQGDGLMVHDVPQAFGYHGNALNRYEKLVDANKILGSQGLRSLTNVRYLLTNAPVPDSVLRNAFGPVAKLVAGPARNAPGTMVYLYDVGRTEGAWVATVATKAADDNALATLEDSRFNAETQRRVALVDTNSKAKVVADLSKFPVPSAIQAKITRPTHSTISVELSAPAQDGNMLIVSENFYPGWKATIDGKPATAERADYTMIGVPLSAGARKIELEFTSRMSEIGQLITWAASTLAVTVVAAGLILGMRRKATPAGA